MSDLEGFLSEAQARVADLIRSAFESGREAGRVEATRELKTKLYGVLNEGTEDLPEPASAEQIAREDRIGVIAEYASTGDKPQSRAAPGSVKPLILMNLLSDRGHGLEMQEVADRNGIKFNSVRGTLYALSADGLAERRDGRWFPTTKLMNDRVVVDHAFKPQDDEASDVEPEGAPSEASHDSPRQEGAAGAVEPVPGGGP